MRNSEGKIEYKIRLEERKYSLGSNSDRKDISLNREKWVCERPWSPAFADEPLLPLKED